MENPNSKVFQIGEFVTTARPESDVTQIMPCAIYKVVGIGEGMYFVTRTDSYGELERFEPHRLYRVTISIEKD